MCQLNYEVSLFKDNAYRVKSNEMLSETINNYSHTKCRYDMQVDENLATRIKEEKLLTYQL
jgi:hypothetical protein